MEIFEDKILNKCTIKYGKGYLVYEELRLSYHLSIVVGNVNSTITRGAVL